MNVTVSWGRDPDQPFGAKQETVDDPRRLDFILDYLTDDAQRCGTPMIVEVTSTTDGFRDDDGTVRMPYGLQFGLGHAERSCLLYVGPDGGFAHETGLSDWPDPIEFDMHGESTDFLPSETRVTPPTVRQAVREYMRTGRRPTNVAWDVEHAGV
ncbi:Imm1 family immunity protein [Actinocatenispora rupis]|uniref:Immunity protein Imm1 n=1 Tax=Actinocatenispora rupis TaxID=519421 RepID=A0A8J3IZL8_9ACTN|nr:Imm1 family immunity protein [Actinocatenispora rupis]GID11498.1 hypothetical protein Aru02nite_23870 [Actinocatenispora rupis]